MYALQVAIYIKNIFSHSAIDNKTSFELFHGKSSQYTQLTLFECIVHVHISKERQLKQFKLFTISIKDFFLDYVEESANYVYYDLEHKKVDISHNLQIVENEFLTQADFSNDISASS